MYFWILLSLLYLGAAGYAPFWLHSIPGSLFEWGVYTTSFVTPLALLWFLIVALLQRLDLKLQREALELQRQSLDTQREELRGLREALDGNATTQMKAAEMTLVATQVARSNAFVNSLPIYHARLERLVQEIGRRLPRVSQPEAGQPPEPQPRDSQTLVDYLTLIEASKIDITKHLGVHAQDVMKLVKEYQTSYGMVLAVAKETNNALLISGPMTDVNDRLVRHFGTQA